MAKSAADDTIDDIESDSETTSSGMMNEHNGSLSSVVQTDRYGFTGGSQFTAPELEHPLPVDVIRKRELKWIEMFENWDKYMNKKYKKVKERCRKGIPPSLRARAWEFLCGAKFLKEHYKVSFADLESQTGDPKWIDDIQKDLHRQFPFHEMFASKGGHGQEDLFKVLKAYSIFNPADGYCQAQAPIAAVLLMHMPAEQAFWCLVSICEKYLPGYYSPGLEAVQIDGDILNGLLKRVCPMSYKHLKKQKLEPILYMTEWFMCVFSRTLPWSSVLRVWDMFFCEGVKVMFRIALVFFKFVLNRPEVLKKCPTMYETMERLRNISMKYMQEDFLVVESLKLHIDEHDMEKEHQKTIARRRAMREQNNIEAQKQLQRKKKNKSPLSSPAKEH